MSVLHINIENKQLVNYDDVIENIKYVTGTIDGINTNCSVTVDSTVTDDDAKQSFRNHLTEKEFSWDNEI